MKIMYIISTGSSDKMPFQVMKTENVFVVSACLLGAQWDWSWEERCVKVIILLKEKPCGLAERYH
jgi:hypothetical protein